jgi:hypothetical protein
MEGHAQTAPVTHMNSTKEVKRKNMYVNIAGGASAAFLQWRMEAPAQKARIKSMSHACNCAILIIVFIWKAAYQIIRNR